MECGSVDLILPGAELTCRKENQRCSLKVCAAGLSPGSVTIQVLQQSRGAWLGVPEPIRSSFVAWLSPGAEFVNPV